MINFIRKLLILVLVALVFALLYFVLVYALEFLPDIKPWQGLIYSVTLWEQQLKIIDIVYFITGLVFFCHGILRLIEISRQNHSARNKDSSLPKILLTDGYYSKVRHPMYGTFILIQAGLLFSLRSSIGLLLAAAIILLQIFNGIREEKNQLIKIFAQDYQEYAQKVKNRYMTQIMKIYFGFAVLLTVVGLFFILIR